MTIDWAAKDIMIPQSDLAFVSGTFYTYDTNIARLAMKTLEASETGMVFQDTHKHGGEVSVAGVTYARTIEIINGYIITFENLGYSVQLQGSNNNLWDIGGGVLTQNLVQVIPTNSAGLIVVTQGSGITEQDKLDIADRVWDELSAEHLTADTFGAVTQRLLEDVTYNITSAEVLGETHLTIWTDATLTTVLRVINIGTVDIPKRLDVP